MKKPVLRSFRPVADARSRVLVLGTMPGPVALKKKEYYGFPGNPFWKIVPDVLGVSPAPVKYADRIAMLREHRIALWDTIRSCERAGASDSAIQRAAPNAIPALLEKYPGIHTVFLNGTLAWSLWRKHFAGKVHVPAHRLPSTSPAHASMPYAKKREAWSLLRLALENRNAWC